MRIGTGATQLLGCSHDAEGMGAASLSRPGATSLVFPIGAYEKQHVDAPDHHLPALLDRHRGIDQIPPDDIPAGMIVVRLNGPRTAAALGFERKLGWGIKSAAKREVREALLSDIGVLMLFIGTDRIKCLDAGHSYNSAEYVRLLEIQIDPFARTLLYIFHRAADMNRL